MKATFNWKKFYRGLGIKCNLSKVVIPDDPGGLERAIIMAQGVGPQGAYDKCQGLFACSKWTDKNLDEMVISDRNARGGPYAIRVCDLLEADEELKNMSANDIKNEKIISETLEERLIHELKFFKETNEHLDRGITHITLCAGSRIVDNGTVSGVPSVFWDDNYDRLRVSWVYLNGVGLNLRARRVVS